MSLNAHAPAPATAPAPAPPEAPVRGVKLKKVQSENETECNGPGQEPRPQVLSQSRNQTRVSTTPPEVKKQIPIMGLMVPRKVHRRPWSSAEKEAVWRQLGGHVLMQSVPGKEACQRCLDLEPDLRGRHWKDVKNQIHNQIQSQKKQQFHAQVDLEDSQGQQEQLQIRKKQQQCQTQMTQQGKDHTVIDHQNKRKQQFLFQMESQEQGITPNQVDQQDHLELHKKQLCHSRLDHQDQIHRKQLYQLNEQTTLDRDSSLLTGTLYGQDDPHRVDPYPLPHRTMGPHIDQLLSRTEWTDESLSQHYSVNRQMDRTLLQDGPRVGPPTHPHAGHVQF